MLDSFRKDVEKCNFTRYHFSKQIVWFPFQVFRFNAICTFSLFQCYVAIKTDHLISNSGIKKSILNQLTRFLSYLAWPVFKRLFSVYIVHSGWMYGFKRKHSWTKWICVYIHSLKLVRTKVLRLRNRYYFPLQTLG